MTDQEIKIEQLHSAIETNLQKIKELKNLCAPSKKSIMKKAQITT